MVVEQRRKSLAMSALLVRVRRRKKGLPSNFAKGALLCFIGRGGSRNNLM